MFVEEVREVVNDGLATTFQVLTKTGNEAAVRVLISALDSSRPSIQEGALVAILGRRSTAGGQEILRRLHTIPEQWKEIIRQRPGRLTRSLRDAVLETERQMCLNGCRAAVWFREYDLVPTLLNVVEDRSSENSDVAAETLTELVGRLYEAMAGPRDSHDRRDPQLIRRHVLSSLESSVKRFSHHKRREVLEAFLQLVARDNVTLKQILQDPHHAAFLAVVDVLSNSPQGGVMRLLLSFLDDPHPPSAALSVVAKRSDLKFVRHLLHKIGREPAATVRQNLKRVKSVTWLRAGKAFFDQLDDAAQHAAVQLAMTSGIPRQEAFSVLEYLLHHGAAGGRREAAMAMEKFNGADANALALKALDDPDPQVQANAVAHVRRRGIPGILPRLVKMADTRYAVVRNAVRETLTEFSFGQYVATFDMLDDEARQSTGTLVRKIDPQAAPLLQAELESRMRTRRLRGLAIARTMGMVELVEQVVIGLLEDEDHLVRAEAATALGHCRTKTSRQALQRALGDRSTTVLEAAQTSLNRQVQLVQP